MPQRNPDRGVATDMALDEKSILTIVLPYKATASYAAMASLVDSWSLPSGGGGRDIPLAHELA